MQNINKGLISVGRLWKNGSKWRTGDIQPCYSVPFDYGIVSTAACFLHERIINEPRFTKTKHHNNIQQPLDCHNQALTFANPNISKEINPSYKSSLSWP